ncbi:sulfotransferase [uncultured Cytophaga sp.]|uniref:sulfotransferase domain-containing protein n=1 Tax=uncultured Cytophaga sp. TaxID=160238 RepID=UPI00262B5D1D|nr:sulfotransferase [uncultured Cytophaga sp.]
MKIVSGRYLRVFLTIKIKQALNAFPFYKHTNYSIFLILSHPRTGSSLLHTYLNSHTRILSLNESFSVTADKNLLLKEYSKTIRAVGLKFFYEYMDEPIKKKLFIDLLSDPRMYIIKVHRRNLLRVYVSLRIAQKTQEWSSIAVIKETTPNKKISLSKRECIETFEQYAKWELETQSILKIHNTPVFEVDYETLTEQPNETLFQIQKFLGISKQKPISLLNRQNAESLNSLIENYDALKESFVGTAYEYFFEA